ncbi:FGGY-family carbohydrate kinase [Microbacterium indicum]|uniref:FGGY-family carbohydrate kinase n=1 Tax=Microbacterium indicum TaxID=358100 RepID=UPI001FDEEF26|nr:FGGY family carbohydrate kinase [Microbacterium indicum]
MTDGVLIGVDLGTTGVKVVLVDSDQGVIASASRANTLSSPAPGWAEADPEQWRTNALSAIAEVVALTPGRRIEAIATTGMVPAVVLVGSDGEPLRPAMLQNDARAGEEVARLTAALSDADPLSATGSVTTQQSVAPKLAWVARHEPHVWRRTYAVLGSYDWLLTALGAIPHVEVNWAVESGLFDLDRSPFAPAVAAVAGAGDRLAPVKPSGAVVGELRADIAAGVGLPAGIPLVVGGADHVLSAYSAGLTQVGDWLVKLGGAGDILAVSEEPITDERFFLDSHTIPHLWLPNGCMATSGSLVRWVQGLLKIEDLAAMDGEAAGRPASEVLCLPYFLGEKSPINDVDLRGVFAGMHLGHDAVDLYRSALEGIAFGFRHNAEVLSERGVLLSSATVTNGGATSLLWKQIHASVLGVPLRTVRNHPGASLGAAIAAGIGVGIFADWTTPLALVEEGDTIEPRDDLVGRYDEAYSLWRELAGATAPTMRALARR